MRIDNSVEHRAQTTVSQTSQHKHIDAKYVSSFDSFRMKKIR